MKLSIKHSCPFYLMPYGRESDDYLEEPDDDLRRDRREPDDDLRRERDGLRR